MCTAVVVYNHALEELDCVHSWNVVPKVDHYHKEDSGDAEQESYYKGGSGGLLTGQAVADTRQNHAGLVEVGIAVCHVEWKG